MPHRVDEFVVDVLLRVVDDTLKVALDIFHELPKTGRVVLGQVVVTRADCCAQISYKELNDPSLVKIRNRHCDDVYLTIRGFSGTASGPHQAVSAQAQVTSCPT